MAIATFNITLSTEATTIITVDYTTVDDTAMAGVNYTTTAGTLSFFPGDLSKTIVVPVIYVVPPNPPLSFKLTLANPSNATILDGTGVAIIPAPVPNPV